MTVLPAVLSAPADLPAAELVAARLDGELFCSAAGYLCVDEPDSAVQRARLAAAGLPPGLVLERSTAAWVHGALPCPPADTWVAIDVRERIRYHAAPGVRVREVRLSSSCTSRLGGVRVTTPLRTVCDLARSAPAPGVSAVLRELCAQHGIDAADVESAFSAVRNLPHRRRALALVRECLSPR